MRTQMILAACLLVAGCNPAPPPSTGTQSPVRQTIHMGDPTLLIDGDDWAYMFEADERRCLIVGTDVAFVEHKDDHVIVNVDLTETQKAAGVEIGSHSLLNIPTNGRHQVLAVVPGGFTDVAIELPEKVEHSFIRAVLNHPDASRTDRSERN